MRRLASAGLGGAGPTARANRAPYRRARLFVGRGRPVDALLVTGDIADHGTEYEEAGGPFRPRRVP
ncbi:hypothetical protein [Streptomyces sp. NPDC051183]|uniref:hypothetical protein n=1 Tax=unclassified Streptomyces TaxID=2593676 RepID=UPI003421B791